PACIHTPATGFLQKNLARGLAGYWPEPRQIVRIQVQSWRGSCRPALHRNSNSFISLNISISPNRQRLARNRGVRDPPIRKTRTRASGAYPTNELLQPAPPWRRNRYPSYIRQLRDTDTAQHEHQDREHDGRPERHPAEIQLAL